MHDQGEAASRLMELADLIDARMTRLRYADEWPVTELTMPQMRVLALLLPGQHRMSEIAASLGISLQAATSLIDRMVDKGLVERVHDPADRRVVICRLTLNGREEIERMYGTSRSRMTMLVEVLSAAELDSVVAAFEIMADAAARLDSSVGRAGLERPARAPVTRRGEPRS